MGIWRATVKGLLAALVPTAAFGLSVLTPNVYAAKLAEPPNVIVIVTDDQTATSLTPQIMPATSRLLVDQGISFNQFIVSDPQCCPSRAAIYTGQYAHNNGVNTNIPGYELLRDKREILPAWMGREGYTTIHIGKYMNGTGEALGSKPAPGWDRWLTATAPSYFSPVFSIDGTSQQFEGQYLTSIENRMAKRAIERYTPKRKPFYMHLDQFAPHEGVGVEGERCAEGSAVPAPGDESLFQGTAAPRPPNYDEADVSDKPPFIQALPRFDDTANVRISMKYSCAIASLREVDRGVAQIVASLRRNHELRQTMIVFLSDNGYSFGEHRFTAGKGLPYEENLRVPFVVRPPASLGSPLKPGSSLDAPVANVDLAPTLLDLAGGKPCISRRECRTMDGRSLLPLLRGNDPDWTKGRAIPIEFFANEERRLLSCEWQGIRTVRMVYVDSTSVPDEQGRCAPSDERELYDLETDPYELKNLDGRPGRSAMEGDAARRSARLQRCAGIKGRDHRAGRRPFCE